MTSDRGTHVCPTDECGARLAKHVLMCRPHWRMVPKVMQREVNAAWRTAQRKMNAQPSDPDRVQAVRDYLIARRAAVDFVNGKVAQS